MSRPRTSVERYGISSSSSTSMPSQKNTATKKPSSTNSKRQSSKKPSLIQELFLQLTNEIGINDSSDYIIPEDLIINQLSGPYKELESNNYRGKKSARRGIDNDDDEPLCACTSATGCTFEKCQNRLMMMECPIGCCPSILDGRHYCENTVIQRKAFPKTEVFYAQSCGLGLRLLEAVPRNAIIIEYLGDVITPEECEERMVDYEMKDNFYFASLDDGLLLDAKPAGSRARFANHCCDPTCELQKWMVLGEPRICIVSKRALAAGAEITYNYQYFNDGMDNTQHQGAGKRKKMKFKRQTCYCGAKNCAGTIGGKVMAADGGNDAWMRKAESMVSGRRKYTLEEVEANLSEYTGPDIELRELEAFGLVNDESSESKVLDSRDLCMALHQLVKRMKSWLEKHQLRLREMLQLSRFINTTEVDSILNQLPKAMKSPESIELEASQKRAMKAERVVRLLLGLPSTSIANNSAVTIENEESSESVAYAVIVDDPNLITSSSSSLFNQVTAPLAVNKLNQTKVSSSQLGSESTSSHRIDWSDLLSTLRDINQSLPVIVPYAQKFVPILQYLGNWSRPILAKAPISSAALATLRRSVESDSLAYRSIKKYVNAYLPIFNIDNSNTNANNASSRNHILENVSDISIYLDIFVLAAYLEGKLEDYINKKNKSKLSVKINQTPQIDPEVEVKTAGAVISKPNGRSSNTSAVIDEEDIVHCFCQQPENCAEIVTMKQCDGCDRWFHPNCVNDPLTRAAVKSRVQQDVSFQCPLCLLSSGQVGPFAAAPQSEWKISVHDAQTDEKTTGVPTKKAAPVVTITKEKSGGKSKIKVKRKTKAKANAIRSVTSTAQENLSPSKSTKRTSSQKNIPLESSAAASTRMRPPFKLSDLEVAIKSESQLKVCRSPGALFLTLIVDYVHSWQQEVTIFLQSDEICALTKPSSELDGTPHDNKHSLAVLLDRCLCLYFDLRVLGVRPPEVDILRQVAWIISVQPVIATHISNTQHSTCDHISSSSDNAENVSAVAPSIDNIVSMHNAAQTLKVSAIVPAIVTLRSLLDATTALHRTLRSVTITDSTSTLEQVHSSLYAHEKTMNISQCFSVVRFRSIILLLEKYHRSSSSSSASSNSASLSPSIVERLQNLVSSNDSKTWHTATSPSPSGCEQYCICRSEGTDGRAMIECSGCLEWFHYDCVHFDPFRATLPVVDVRNNVPDGSFTEDNTDIAMEKISTEEAETIEVCLDIKPILDDGFDKTTSQHDLNHKYTQNQNSRKGSRKHQVVCESDIDKIEYFCVACSEVLSGSNAYLYKWNDN